MLVDEIYVFRYLNSQYFAFLLPIYSVIDFLLKFVNIILVNMADLLFFYS